MVVHGEFVDVSTGAEVRTLGNAPATGITASLSNGVGGFDTHVTLHLSNTAAAPFGKYTVLIHFAVELHGPDTLRIELFDHGTVSGVSIASPAPRPDGSYLVGEILSVHLTGGALSNAALVSQPARGMTVLETVSRSLNDATFHVRFDSSGVVTFKGTTSVFDGRQGSAPDYGCPFSCYAGTTPSSFVLRILPRVTSVSPTSAATGTSVTLGGSRIAPKGYSAAVDFTPKYSKTSIRGGDGVAVTATPSGSGWQFTAPSRDISADSGRLRYVVSSGPRDSLATTSVSVPPLNVTGFAPDVRHLDSVGVSGARRPMIRIGAQEALGLSLVPEIIVSTRTFTTFTLAGSTTNSTLPTISFGGTAITAQSAGFRSSSTRIPGLMGADSVVFTIPAGGSFVDTITRALTISTPGGSQTIQNVMFVPPGTVSEVRTFGTIDVSVPVGGTLVRGKQYRLRGKGLVIQTGGGSPELPHVLVNGLTATVSLAPSPSLEAVFTVPTAATSGPLTVLTVIGLVTVGSFTVSDPPAALTIAGLSLSPTTVAGGRSITATVAINGTVPAGGSAGNITLTLPTPNAAVVLPTSAIAVTANPMVVTIPTRAVNTQQSIVIRAGSDPNATTTSSTTATVTLTPPIPTALTLTPASTPGGTTVRAVVHMNTTAAVSAGIAVALANSDPTTATVPSSAIMSGDSAVFSITTAIVPVDRPVTITATSGGQSQSATLTVRAPTLTSVVAQPTSIIPGAAAVNAMLTLSGAVATPTPVTIVCDPALTCPTGVSVNTGQNTAPFSITSRPVPTSVNAPIDVTLNGQTVRGTLTLTPLAIQTSTMSPATVPGGVKSSLTIQLNAPIPAGQTAVLTFSSDNPSVPAPASVTLAAGTITKLVPILTQGTVTQSTVVTITTTLTQTTATTANVSRKTTTITVTP